MSKSRVFVVCFTGNTGLTDYAVSLCRELVSRCSVFLVTSNSFDSSKYGVKFPSLHVFRRTRHYLLDIFRFLACVISNRPKVLLFQSWLKAPILDAVLVRFLGIVGVPSVVTVHDLLPHYPKPWSRAEMRFFYRSFKGAVLHSNRQVEDFRELGLKTPALMVPHGVYDIFNTRGLSKLDAVSELSEIDPGRYTVLFFGFLGERKGVLEFLEAAMRLRDDMRFQFVVAGQPEPKKEILSALESARGYGNVVVHDHSIPHDEVQIYFAACDLVALPYIEGTTSGVVKLAIAFGKPILCTDIGDFPETLNAWSGLSIKKDDIVSDMVEQLNKAYEARDALADKTRFLAADMRWDRIATRYLEFLDSVIE